jgi:hypothetical protein
VKAWHIIHDTEWCGGIRLRYTLRGVENLAPELSRLEERPPVTEEMLNILDAELDHDDGRDAAVFAGACCSFWGQIRLGEALSETQGSFIPGRVPLVSNLAPPSTSAGSRILRLPHTKMKGDKGEDTMLCRQRGSSDPINAVENHLHVNNLPPDLPLFSFRRPGGIICMTKKILLNRWNEIWSRHSYPARTGHCFRIGRTTELLLAGVPPVIVQIIEALR